MKENIYVFKYCNSFDGKFNQRKFKTEKAALKFARELLTEIKPTGYFEYIKNKKRCGGGQTAVTLEKIFSDPFKMGDFESEFNNNDEETYDEESWSVHKDSVFCQYVKGEDLLIIEYSKNPKEYRAREGYLSESRYDDEPEITEISDDTKRLHYFVFYCEDVSSTLLAPGSKNYLELFIDEIESYNKKNYPILVCELIDEQPRSIDEIITELKQRYNVSICDKTVKSYISIIKDLGYNVVDEEKSYTMWVRGTEGEYTRQRKRRVYYIDHKK